MTKSCIVCGKILIGGQRKLCSDRECHIEKRKESNRKWRLNNQERIKECRLNNQEKAKEYNRKYYQKHSKKLKAYGREYGRIYYQNNQEEKKEYQREYHLKNREKIKRMGYEYRLNNRKRIKECRLFHYQNNWEKILRRNIEWRLKNREMLKDKRYKKYRRSRGLPEDWDLSRESSIETIMRRWLQETDIKFIQQHYISLENSTWTRVDFYIPEANICLYVDGDYWHGPEKPDIQERDARINKALERMDYIVIRLSESDILAGVRPIEILETLCAIHAA